MSAFWIGGAEERFEFLRGQTQPLELVKAGFLQLIVEQEQKCLKSSISSSLRMGSTSGKGQSNKHGKSRQPLS